jgi:hypothetical protein
VAKNFRIQMNACFLIEGNELHQSIGFIETNKEACGKGKYLNGFEPISGFESGLPFFRI